MLELVPYTKPVSEIVPVAPVKEADRVAPVALLLELEPVVTVAVAVWPPEPPVPDSPHLYVTTISVIRTCPPLALNVTLLADPVHVWEDVS